MTVGFQIHTMELHSHLWDPELVSDSNYSTHAIGYTCNAGQPAEPANLNGTIGKNRDQPHLIRTLTNCQPCSPHLTCLTDFSVKQKKQTGLVEIDIDTSIFGALV